MLHCNGVSGGAGSSFLGFPVDSLIIYTAWLSHDHGKK